MDVAFLAGVLSRLPVTFAIFRTMEACRRCQAQLSILGGSSPQDVQSTSDSELFSSPAELGARCFVAASEGKVLISL